MAGLQVHYELSDELSELVQKILQKYENKFWYVQFSDILCVEEYNKRPKHIAKVRLLEPPLNMLSDKQVIIEIARQHWDELTENQRLVVTYHELMHLEFDFENNKYKLRNHDVEDFHTILNTFGLHWAKPGNDVPNILENPDIWLEEL